MPSDWKRTDIVAIVKKGNRKECKNYRGLSSLLSGQWFENGATWKVSYWFHLRSKTVAMETLQVWKGSSNGFLGMGKAYDGVNRNKVWVETKKIWAGKRFSWKNKRKGVKSELKLVEIDPK